MEDKINRAELEKLLSDASRMADDEIKERLDFQSPKFIASKGSTALDEEVLIFVKKLFTNIKYPVAAYKIGGLLSGMLTCKQSRISGDVRVVAARMIQANSALKESCRALNIPDYLSEIGCPFFRSVFDEYGDDSVARVATFGAVFEDVSMLQAMALLHHRVLFGIEKSTRYKDYSARNEKGRFQYSVDSIIKEKSMEDEFRKSTDCFFELYKNSLTQGTQSNKSLIDFLRKRLPLEKYAEKVQDWLKNNNCESAGKEELESGYYSVINSSLKDQVRHLLPLSTRTSLSLEFNAEALRHLIYAHQSRFFGEGIFIQELLRRELSKLAGPLLAGTEPDSERAKAYRDFFFETRMPLLTDFKRCEFGIPNQVTVDKELKLCIEHHGEYVKIKEDELNLEVIMRIKGDLDDVVAAILAEKITHITERDALLNARKMSEQEKRRMLFDYAGISECLSEKDSRTNRRHRPGRAFESLLVNETMMMPVAEVRDLRRHTLQSYKDPMYFAPENGFYISPGLKDSPLEKEIQKANASAVDLWSMLIENDCGPYAASTALPMSVLTPMNTEINLRNEFHINELRTQPGAAPVYLRLRQMAFAGLRALIPELGPLFKYVNKETEIDYGRALQEARSREKQKKSGIKIEMA